MLLKHKKLNEYNKKAGMDLPTYTRSEEIFNMVSHITGGGLGVLALVACVLVAALNHNAWGVVSGAIYGTSVILLFTMSSIYHGLKREAPKRLFQVFDHCTIFVLIAGTYTPIALTQFRVLYPVQAWLLFGIIWGLAIIGIILKTIVARRFMAVSLTIYLGMGWIALFFIRQLVEVYGLIFFILILTGGVLYTVGVVFYGLGKKKKFMHSVFHLFVNTASIVHSVAIAIFVMS
jgi:hemolysin III